MSSAFPIADTDTDTVTAELSSLRAGVKSPGIQALSSEHEGEALAFLSLRPAHTIFMAGLIRDNGLVSLSNRGTFFGCRNQQGQLTGVALIGDKTLIETSDALVLDLLAQLPRRNPNAHLVRGEQQQIEFLLRKYAEVGRASRLVCRELLLDQVAPLKEVDPEPNLLQACNADLESVVATNAALSYEENGVDPLKEDPRGIRERTTRRVARGRVWILVERGQMIFKADVISETPTTVFIEGVYVSPEHRRQGHALRCLTQLARNLLDRTICLVVNEKNLRARELYAKAGYQFRSYYQTAYFLAI